MSRCRIVFNLPMAAFAPGTHLSMERRHEYA
jgi:hypothetical protein